MPLIAPTAEQEQFFIALPSIASQEGALVRAVRNAQARRNGLEGEQAEPDYLAARDAIQSYYARRERVRAAARATGMSKEIIRALEDTGRR